ncbi:hypothetical protein ACP70R_001848 [Stipagrostis hirtigluma subsp. patula]
MPMERRREDEGAAAPVAGGSGIGVLPDSVLAHVLGFLPAEEAVRTCVLARRWRHLWKSATGLRVVAADGEFLGTEEKLQDFVGRVLLLREGAPLDTCVLGLGIKWHNSDSLRCVSTWFWHAVTCSVRFLRLQHNILGPFRHLEDKTLVSQHLTRLELSSIGSGSNFLDFSSCPVLEHLVLSFCNLSRSAKKISSTSLKYLSMTYNNLVHDYRIHIYAPNLISLRLDSCSGKTPILESMPSLVDAYVQLDEDSADQCKLWHPHYEGEDCGCESCQNSNNLGDDSNRCVLLKGLSEATNLMLISEPTTFIFRMDLRWCPTFSKLKTLLLNDYWCVPDDFHALSCILEHSPVLEKLTLLFAEELEPEVELEGSINPTERSAAISEHLKKVEVKCEVVGERILKVIWFLRMFNIPVSGKSKSELQPHCTNTHVAGSF